MLKKGDTIHQNTRYFGQEDLESIQDLVIFGFQDSFFFGILPKVFKKSINSSIGLVLSIINLEILLKQFLSSTNLPGAQFFHIHQVAQIVVICKNKGLMLTTL